MSKKKLRHSWLDAKDPANCVNGGKGFWVPTPEAIEQGRRLAKKKSLRARKGMLWGDQDERSQYRPTREVTFFAHCEMINDPPQLCDCPYWGTEFND